jgi:hypothetical protein
MSLIMSSRDEQYEHYPVVAQQIVGNMLFQQRRAEDGVIDTWRTVQPSPPIESIGDAVESIEK